jgi:hypothetical protein
MNTKQAMAPKKALEIYLITKNIYLSSSLKLLSILKYYLLPVGLRHF